MPAARRLRRTASRCRRFDPTGSTSRHRRMARQASLYGEADRGVGGAETEIAAPLHDLEKEAFLEGAGINLQIFGSAFAVVEDVMRLELLDPLGRKIGLGCDIVI